MLQLTIDKNVLVAILSLSIQLSYPKQAALSCEFIKEDKIN